MSDHRLPDQIARHLSQVLPDSGPTPARVQVMQTGEMIRRPGDRPLSFAAVQEYAVESVEFEWRAAFGPNRLVRLAVVDRYREGEGLLTAKVWGLVPVVRSSGPETDRGEAMRYLAELPWVPHAIASNPELTWRELGDGSVEVSTRVANTIVSVELSLDEQGLIRSASAMRPRLGGGPAIDTPWVGEFGDYVELSGIRVPEWAEVSWDLPEGRFTYWRGEVTSLVAGTP
jgi:hypothetical protein